MGGYFIGSGAEVGLSVLRSERTVCWVRVRRH